MSGESERDLEKAMRIKSMRAMSAAVRQAYRRGEEEETLEPLVLFDSEGSPVGRVGKSDSVIFTTSGVSGRSN